MSYGMWLVTLLFIIVMLVAGMTHFFGSDYAQKKWNPDYGKDSKS